MNLLAGKLYDPKLPDYLLGLYSSIWKDESLGHDLISLNAVDDFDIMMHWLNKLLPKLYHRLLGHRKHARRNTNADVDLFHYENSHLGIPVNIMSTAVASLSPVLAIVVLYLVHNMRASLGLVPALQPFSRRA